MTQRLLLTGVLVLLSAGVGRAVQVEPAPRTYVEDRAGVLDAQSKGQLIGLLQELEQKTGARVIVLTVDTTGGQDLHQFAFERAEAWKFGANRKSASALVVVAVKDRKYRIEVGYDLEGVLPDGYVGELARDYMVPHFKAGRYGQGIFDGTAVLAQRIAQEGDQTLTGMPEIRKRRRPMLPCGGGILPLLIIMSLFSGRRHLSGRRHRGMLFWGLLAGSMMGGGRGGGFGGGGFGGFGGGGGGGFGGGGAGGGW